MHFSVDELRVAQPMFAGSQPLQVLAHHFDCVQHQVRFAAGDLTPDAGAAVRADLQRDLDAGGAHHRRHGPAPGRGPACHAQRSGWLLLMLWPGPPGWAAGRPGELALQVQAFLRAIERVLAAERAP